MNALQYAYSIGHGTLSPALYLYAISIEREQNNSEQKQIMSLIEGNKRKRSVEDECNLAAETSKRTKTEKSQESSMLYVLDANGQLRRGTPTDSLWWLNYVLLPREKLSKRDLHKFRHRFRMPYDSWKVFVERLNGDSSFAAWQRGKKDCCGQDSSPIELLSLASLRYLGRKCTFDDLEELTFISERTIRRFFQQFITFGGTQLYKELVVAPSSPEEVASHTREMAIAGFPGCAGSTDATTIVICKCRYGLRQMHLGHKDKKTARTYNITVNHRRKILATTDGHPSRWNDKTVVLFDDFITNLKNGKLDDHEFYLLEKDKTSGEVVKIRYKGAWVLVDNGYLDWSVTIPPYKLCSRTSRIRWSQWLESMRKDVECVIGILKKRWAILDKGQVRLKMLISYSRHAVLCITCY